MHKITLSKNKRRVLFVVGIALTIALVWLFIYLRQTADYKQAVKNITFDTIDVATIRNGSYTGECDVNFIYAKVKVTVADGKIEKIDIVEHKNDKGKSAETITNSMIAGQTLEVDYISGATNSSIVIKKAVENALSKGI